MSVTLNPVTLVNVLIGATTIVIRNVNKERSHCVTRYALQPAARRKTNTADTSPLSGLIRQTAGANGRARVYQASAYGRKH
jgi:hypothetical protein